MTVDVVNAEKPNPESPITPYWETNPEKAYW